MTNHQKAESLKGDNFVVGGVVDLADSALLVWAHKTNRGPLTVSDGYSLNFYAQGVHWTVAFLDAEPLNALANLLRSKRDGSVSLVCEPNLKPTDPSPDERVFVELVVPEDGDPMSLSFTESSLDISFKLCRSDVVPLCRHLEKLIKWWLRRNDKDAPA